MLRKMFSPLPVFLTILTTLASLYYAKNYLPQYQITQKAKIAIEAIELQKISSKLRAEVTNSLKSMHNNHDSVTRYLLSNQLAPSFYKSSSDLTLNKKDNSLNINFTYASISQDSNKLIKVATKSLAETIHREASAQLKNKLQELEQTLSAEKKEYLTTKSQAPTEEKDPSKSKPTTAKKKDIKKISPDISKIPAEATTNLKKFKTYKEEKAKRLKEIQEVLKNMPALGEAKLKLLTSNLQKSYLLEEHRLNLNIKYGPQKNKVKIKSYRTSKQTVVAKLMQENVRLRDESHFLKGQQDQALRTQKFSLLQEQKNLSDTIHALEELQQYMFKSDQQAGSSSISHSTKQNSSNKNNTPDKTKISSLEHLQESIATLEAKISSTRNQIKILSNQPLNISYSKPAISTKPFFKSWFILTPIGVQLFFMLIITGLIFGRKLNITKGELAAEILDTQLLGNIPDLPNNGLENAKHKRFTDAIDKITNEISNHINEKNIKTINILSPTEDEGTTQLTGMISLSYNLNQKMKVIALDMKMRGSKVADFLQLKTKMLPTDDGVISYFKELNEKQEINETENNQWLAKLVKPCIKNGIFAISPGKGPFDDDMIVNTKSINTMYNGLSRYVDLIIVNSPAIKSDKKQIALTIAENTDGNILLLKKGLYTKKDLLEIKETISTIPLLGIVFK